MRTSIKALAVITAGILVLHTPARVGHAKPVGGDCIRGCCFCIDDPGGLTCNGFHFGDLDCYARGCAYFVQCLDAGQTNGCTGNQVMLECVP